MNTKTDIILSNIIKSYTSRKSIFKNREMVMNKETQKIIDLLKKDTEISQVLFKFSSWFDDKRDLPLI